MGTLYDPGKAPWWKFSPDRIMKELVWDAPLDTLGAYFRLLFKLHYARPERGVLRGTSQWLMRQAGADPANWRRIWGELIMSECFEVHELAVEPNEPGSNPGLSHESHTIVTVMSRSMVREEKKRKADATRQFSHRHRKAQAESHADVTPDVTPDVTAESRGRIKNIENRIEKKRTFSLKQFERWWAYYPRKQAKRKAREAWIRADIDEGKYLMLCDAVVRQKKWDQWQRGIIPLPATWLNQERWTDEEPPREQSNTGQAAERARSQAQRNG